MASRHSLARLYLLSTEAKGAPALLQGCCSALCLPQEMFFPVHLLQDRSQNRVSRWKRWICLTVMPSRGQMAPRGDPATCKKRADTATPRGSRGLVQPCLCIYFSQVLWQRPCIATSRLLPQEFTAGAGAWRMLAGKSQAPGKNRSTSACPAISN